MRRILIVTTAIATMALASCGTAYERYLPENNPAPVAPVTTDCDLYVETGAPCLPEPAAGQDCAIADSGCFINPETGIEIGAETNGPPAGRVCSLPPGCLFD